MKEKQFAKLLKKLGACEEAAEWAQGKDLKTVWETCERGDWLLWLVGQMANKPGWPTAQQVVLAACACAETALKYVPEGEGRPKQAIDVARRWGRGQASIVEVAEAVSAASEAASEVVSAAWAASEAASEVVSAAWAASEAAVSAAWAAWAVSEAAAWAVSAAWAARAARASALRECADIVRRETQLPLLTEGK